MLQRSPRCPLARPSPSVSGVVTQPIETRHNSCREPWRPVCNNSQTRPFGMILMGRWRSMIDSDAIPAAKLALGRQLAACREAAGLKQQDLSPRIHFGRSTIANAETGRTTCSRDFWEQCDRELAAGGALVRGYEDLQALIRAHYVEVSAVMEQRRVSKL